MKKILLSWSSGKDSAWAFHLLKQRTDVRVVALLTTFNNAADRVAMHAVRRTLVERQAQRLDLQLWPVELPWPCSNDQYAALMSVACDRAVAEGIEGIAFGDLFLRDIRAYREQQLSGTRLEPIFPLWDLPTRQLAFDMIDGGLKAKVTCVDPAQLDRAFAGREFDREFIESLPESVDPCGEKGEFHSFVYDSPDFERPIAVESGEIVERDGFVFADVIEGPE